MKMVMVTMNGDALKGDERPEFAVRRIFSEKRNVLKHKEGWTPYVIIRITIRMYFDDIRYNEDQAR